MRSERMNPLLVALAVLSENESVEFDFREPKRMKPKKCEYYLFHSLHNGQIAVTLLDNIHRHV